MRLYPLAAAVTVTLAGWSCASEQPDLRDFDPGPTPLAYIPGEAMFNGSCAPCHGPHALGGENGPPLVNEIYEPNHHADITFQRAVELGVAPHHWNFGPMPPVEGLSADQVDAITAYVRWLQHQAGIY